MTTEACHIVEELLADEGLEALRDKPSALAHLRSCASCRALLLALQELDGQLATLPAIEPAPDVVERALAAVGAPPVAVETTAEAPEVTPSPEVTTAAEPAPRNPVQPSAKPATLHGAGRPPVPPRRSASKRRTSPYLWAGAAGLLAVALAAGLFGVQMFKGAAPDAVMEHSEEYMYGETPPPAEPGRFGDDRVAGNQTRTESSASTPATPQGGDGGAYGRVQGVGSLGGRPEEVAQVGQDFATVGEGEAHLEGRGTGGMGLRGSGRGESQPHGSESEVWQYDLDGDSGPVQLNRPAQTDAVAEIPNARPGVSAQQPSDREQPTLIDLPSRDSNRGPEPLVARIDSNGIVTTPPPEPEDYRTLDEGGRRNQREREVAGEDVADQSLGDELNNLAGGQLLPGNEQTQEERLRGLRQTWDADNLQRAVDPCPFCDVERIPTTIEDLHLGLDDGEWEPGSSFETPPVATRTSTLGWWAQPVSEVEAEALLARWDATEGLAFQSPTGYWANTYVPGDPLIRELQQRLVRAESDSSLAMYGATGRELAEASQTYTQPFDPPRGSAMAVYLATDRQGVSGPSRVLLQVGLQGTARQTGRRPAMQVAVVLDLTDSPGPQAAAALEAVLLALADARDIGDGFSLFVAGQPGGLVIPADSFRYGPLTLAAGQLFRNEAGPRLGDAAVTHHRAGALQAAAELLGAANDPESPLGTSAILFVTPSQLGYDLGDVEAVAHVSAVAGIPVSAIGVGNAVDVSELERIALAGQGNRRLVVSADDAETVVHRELAAASRAVARAVRLRIRLAAGVQLIDVLGSRRLDEGAAQRVREAEQSIDQRLARSLGIAADRGEDEEGIQIVIPAFYAEDSHVILLDVLVPGPGPVADVTVRYKDLVFSRNAVARDSLALPHGEGERGPLELTVLKNRIAHEVATALRESGSLLAAGDANGALAELAEAIGLVSGAGQVVAGLAADPEVQDDLVLLTSYATHIDRMTQDGMPFDDLTDSLLYASYLKLLPPPAAD